MGGVYREELGSYFGGFSFVSRNYLEMSCTEGKDDRVMWNYKYALLRFWKIVSSPRKVETSRRWHEVPHVLITRPCPLNLNLPGKCFQSMANPMDSYRSIVVSPGFRGISRASSSMNPGVNVLPLACKPILLRSTGPARWLCLVNLPTQDCIKGIGFYLNLLPTQGWSSV